MYKGGKCLEETILDVFLVVWLVVEQKKRVVLTMIENRQMKCRDGIKMYQLAVKSEQARRETSAIHFATCFIRRTLDMQNVFTSYFYEACMNEEQDVCFPTVLHGKEETSFFKWTTLLLVQST